MKIERFENYKALMKEDEKFRKLHEKLEQIVIKVAEKKGYKRIQFGTIGDFYLHKKLNGRIVTLTTMTLARILKR